MAIVRYIQNRAVILGGEEHSGWLPNGAPQPLPTPDLKIVFDLVIEQEADGSCLLIRDSRPPGHSGDTWHPNLVDALAKASDWFGIEIDEWSKGAPSEPGDEQ